MLNLTIHLAQVCLFVLLSTLQPVITQGSLFFGLPLFDSARLHPVLVYPERLLCVCIFSSGSGYRTYALLTSVISGDLLYLLSHCLL